MGNNLPKATKKISPKAPTKPFCKRGHSLNINNVKYNPGCNSVQCRECIKRKDRYRQIAKQIVLLQARLESLKEYAPIRKVVPGKWEKPIPGELKV